MKHIHADLMAEYAKDAQETDKPWERWEIETFHYWENLSTHPMWDKGEKYRRKPKTININGFEVPEPVRKPLEQGQNYYVPEINVYAKNGSSWLRVMWVNNEKDDKNLQLGLIHLTKEAAELHAKALLSFTEIKN